MKFNLYDTIYIKIKPFLKFKKINKEDQLKPKNVYKKKTEIHTKNRKTVVDFAMAPIGHHT